MAKKNPQYIMIASDIANRISRQEWEEGQKISGRSLLSSEYKVSPETIRRALTLLADMKVVSIKKNSGVFILSIDNAKRYLADFDDVKHHMDMQSELRELIEKSDENNRKINDILSKLIKAQTTITNIKSSFPNYEAKIKENSKVIGKNLGSLRFWQRTKATIIAIKRGQSIIISPGPEAELYEQDTIVFVGSSETPEQVDKYLNE